VATRTATASNPARGPVQRFSGPEIATGDPQRVDITKARR
jgi:hypothetical protein